MHPLLFHTHRETIEKVYMESARKTAMKDTTWGTQKLQLECVKEHETYLKVGQIWHQRPEAQRRLKEQYKLVTSRRLSHFNTALGEIKQKKCCCCELMSLWEIILSEQPSAISAMSWLSKSPFHLQWAPETLSGTKSQERISPANKTPVQVSSQFLSLFTEELGSTYFLPVKLLPVQGQCLKLLALTNKRQWKRLV